MQLPYFLGSAFISVVLLLQGCAGAVVGGAAAGGGLAAHDRRTTGDMVDDESIEFQALNEYYSSAKLRENTHLNFTSYNALLLITGEAPSQELKNLAERSVKDLAMVKRVQNEVIVSAPSAMLTRSSDTYLTAKVKVSLSSITTLPGFDPTRVKVVSENGTVFLMGLLTQKEAQEVTNKVRQVGGVQRVVKVFEYIR